jgi:formylglycine-generating enzyme required for sulfatase activity
MSARAIPLFIGLLLSLAPWLGRRPVVAVAPPIAPRTITNSLGMKFVRIAPGSFRMGSPLTEQGRRGREEQHPVTITRGFYLQTTEVTQKQYERVMATNPSQFSEKGSMKARVEGMDTGSFPVDSVSWGDAVRFCEKLSGLKQEKAAGRRYRLPTEAEWEYACRGGSSQDTPFWTGFALSSRQANIDGDHAYGGARKGPGLQRTCKVGAYKPNGFGLYDMDGNVGEWCSDWYDAGYYARSPRRDPQGPPRGECRVYRGGLWFCYAVCARSAARSYLSPGLGSPYVGFRVVLEFSPKKVP